MKQEANASIVFRHWVMSAFAELETSSFEIKQTGTNALPFNALEEHQENFSEAIRYSPKGVLIRVESGTIGAPDYIYLKNEPAFIVVKFPKQFSIIDIDTWKLEKGRSKRKSLTADRAEAISWKTVRLK